MKINNRIKELREKSNITLKQVAEHLGCSTATAQRYESDNGIKQIPYEAIEKYAELFNVSPASLLGWDSIEQSNNCNASNNIGGEQNTYTTTNNYYANHKHPSKSDVTEDTKNHFFRLIDIVRNMDDKNIVELIKYAEYLSSK